MSIESDIQRKEEGRDPGGVNAGNERRAVKHTNRSPRQPVPGP